MSPARPKVPHVLPAPLIREDGDVLSIRTVLWRIHRTEGEHVRGWSELRTFGPLPSMPYDPQASPIGEHSEGDLYAATDLVTALAEVFQASRTIDVVSFAPRATAWIPTQPLSLLDLTGTWALRNGAAYSFAQAPRSTCRRRARVIHDTWLEIDGLWAQSTMTGRPTVVPWDTAGASFPAHPEFSRQLSTPALLAVIRGIARTEIDYRLAECRCSADAPSLARGGGNTQLSGFGTSTLTPPAGPGFLAPGTGTSTPPASSTHSPRPVVIASYRNLGHRRRKRQDD